MHEPVGWEKSCDYYLLIIYKKTFHFSNHCLLYKHQWNTKWAFPRKLHIFTCEDNMLSSHVKRSPSLWLQNKSHLWKQADLVFHWCWYNKQNITYSLMDMNFIFLCSTGYLTRSLRSLVKCWVDHSKIKFISTRGHVISYMTQFCRSCTYADHHWESLQVYLGEKKKALTWKNIEPSLHVCSIAYCTRRRFETKYAGKP